jgi:hypothetical protein
LIPPRRGAPAGPAAPGEPDPGIEARLARVGDLVERFRIEAERYFSGAVELPPEELRAQIQRALRDLRSVTLRSAVEQFRMSSLEARFNTLTELYGRRLRDREEGRGAAARARPLVAAQPRYDPEAGIVVGREPDGAAVEALFAGLARAGGAARLDLDSFRGYLEKQAAEIRAKTGAERVQFRLAQEEGKIKLKARPVRSDGTAG